MLGVPVQSKTLNGLDSLLSIVQMPAGVPVATFAIGVAGAKNAALFAMLDPRSQASGDRGGARQIPHASDRLGSAEPRPERRHHDAPGPRMTVGIVGAGQLGRMLALAGYPLGLDFLFLDPTEDAPAGQVAPQIIDTFTSAQSLDHLAQESDVLTFDWENISVDALNGLPSGTLICPPVKALAAAQDRVKGKAAVRAPRRFPTTRWRNVESQKQLEKAVVEIGLPAVLKTRRMGYDGKGQKSAAQAGRCRGCIRGARQRAAAARRARPLRLRSLDNRRPQPQRRDRDLPAQRQRAWRRHIAAHARTVRHAGPATRSRARYLRRALTHFKYTGILTIEFFVRRGKLIANEMAPRVHNSGHWTDRRRGDQPVRESPARRFSICRWARRASRGHCAMLNLIGDMPDQASTSSRTTVCTCTTTANNRARGASSVT